jgi:hypothetical protein
VSLHVRNWEKFQHADVAKNKLRAPAWVRVYTELLSSEAYMRLSPTRRAMLVGIWLEYARTRRELSEDTASLTRRLGQRVTSTDLQALSDAGFIEISHDTLTKDSRLEESRHSADPSNAVVAPVVGEAKRTTPGGLTGNVHGALDRREAEARQAIVDELAARRAAKNFLDGLDDDEEQAMPP